MTCCCGISGSLTVLLIPQQELLALVCKDTDAESQRLILLASWHGRYTAQAVAVPACGQQKGRQPPVGDRPTVQREFPG